MLSWPLHLCTDLTSLLTPSTFSIVRRSGNVWFVAGGTPQTPGSSSAADPDCSPVCEESAAREELPDLGRFNGDNVSSRAYCVVETNFETVWTYGELIHIESMMSWLLHLCKDLTSLLPPPHLSKPYVDLAMCGLLQVARRRPPGHLPPPTRHVPRSARSLQPARSCQTLVSLMGIFFPSMLCCWD